MSQGRRLGGRGCGQSRPEVRGMGVPGLMSGGLGGTGWPLASVRAGPRAAVCPWVPCPIRARVPSPTQNALPWPRPVPWASSGGQATANEFRESK